MTQDVSLALDARSHLGEGPRWYGEEKRLYWVDIGRNELHRFDPANGHDESRTFATSIGCFAFMRGGGLMLAMKDGFARLPRFDAEPEPFGEQIFADKPDLRFNDGRTDGRGRFWTGSTNMTKAAKDAALYRLDPDGTIMEMAGSMLTCNGAAFSPDGKRFFHTDTPSHAVRTYDFDVMSGTIANCRILHQFPLGRGRPDGASVDAEGCYWTALFDGGRVVRLSPDGEILAEIPLPAKRPTMIVFGDDDLRTAYVTTARNGLTSEELKQQPLSGGIFRFRVDVPGLAEAPFGSG